MSDDEMFTVFLDETLFFGSAENIKILIPAYKSSFTSLIPEYVEFTMSSVDASCLRPL